MELVFFSGCFEKSLSFDNWIIVCLGVALFRFNLFGAVWASWIWMSISFPRFRKFSVIIVLNTLSVAFSFSSPSELPIMWRFFLFFVSHRSYRLSLLCFYLFFISPLWLIFNVLSSRLLILFFFFFLWSLLFLQLSIEFLSIVIVFFDSIISMCLSIFFDGFYWFVELLILSMCCFPNSFSSLCVLVVH